MSTLILPDHSPPTDPATDPFWEAARDGRLVLPRCRDCMAWRWYPQPQCPECGGDGASEWREVAPAGGIVTWTRVHKPLLPDGPRGQAVGLIALDDAPDVRVALPIDASETEIAIGQRVSVRFHAFDTHVLPYAVPEVAV